MLNNFVGSFIISIVNLLLWSKLLDNKINFKDYRLYIGIIFMTTMLVINFFAVNELLKTVLVLLIILVTIKIIFNVDLKTALIISIVNQLLYIISEIIVIIIVLIITNIQNNQELVDKFFGTIYANAIISFSVFIIMQFSFIKKWYNKIIDLSKNEKTYATIVITFMAIVIASLLFNLIYYSNNLVLLSCGGLVLLIIYLFFIIKNMIMRNSYLNMYFKYNDTLQTLKSYEDILDKYKVSNHENKNQLLMIRNMLIKEQKNDVSKYIDNLVQNEYKDDENLNMETSKIPSGGLRALIYSKLIYMKNNDIPFELKVDRMIRNIQLTELSESIILDVCKIVGVFLDNAIEEIKNIKNGNISVDLYIADNKLNISIGNTFEGSINLDKIDEMKYTTKGSGHGYGLTLVKEIINKNSILENIRMINDDVFIQILRIEF